MVVVHVAAVVLVVIVMIVVIARDTPPHVRTTLLERTRKGIANRSWNGLAWMRAWGRGETGHVSGPRARLADASGASWPTGGSLRGNQT